jgi:hypothetical protein
MPGGESVEGWLNSYTTAEPFQELQDLEPPPTVDRASDNGAGVDILAPPPESPTPLDVELAPPPPPDVEEKLDLPEPPPPSAKATTESPAPTVRDVEMPPPPASSAKPGEGTTVAEPPPPTETPIPPRAPDDDRFPTPFPVAAPPRERPPRSRRLLAIVVVVGLVALAAGVGALLLRDDDKAPEVSFPASWDPRVERLAQFVEAETNATFPNPVHVDFLSPPEYEERARGVAHEDSAARYWLLRLPVGALRALGLVQGDADLAVAAETLDASRPAVYSTTTQRIAVRGEQLDANVNVAIVRALTLALDQQRFGLKTFDSDEAAWAYAALREGDAARVVRSYLEALDPAEREGVDDPFAADVAGATEVVRVMARAPGVLGEQLVVALLADGGEQVLARAFDKPPFSQEHLYDASAFLSGNDPKDVTAPSVETGEEQRSTTTLGVFNWLVVLGEHSAPDAALRAADGWGGDAAMEYTFQKRECVRDRWIGDTREDVNEMSDAAAAWVTAMPPGNTQFSNEGGVITLTTCDPGPTEPISTGTVKEAFALVQLRADAFRAQVGQSVPVDKAWCVADKVASNATLEDAQRENVLESPDYASKIAQYSTDCS